MKLWLDDEREAPVRFTCFSTTCDWTVARNAQDAITFLKTGLVTEISFDHDLGPREHYGDGYDVAKWIEEAAFEGRIPRIIWRVHSGNAVGRSQIYMAMKNANDFWTRNEAARD
jgi:hypothetical protein